MTLLSPFAFRVFANSTEQLLAAKEIAKSRSKPEFVDADDTWIKKESGEKVAFSRSLKVGDYFDSIKVVSRIGNSFDIVFHRKDGCDPYWKDVAVRFLAAIGSSGVEVERIY